MILIIDRFFTSNIMLYTVYKPREDRFGGFINSQGELIVEPIYNLVGHFSEDRCGVEKDERRTGRYQGYIDSTGQEIIPMKKVKYTSNFS